MRGKNSGAEHLEENAQAIVVKACRRSNDRGSRRPVTRFQHLREGLGEI
jgi:hypothetical protein